MGQEEIFRKELERLVQLGKAQDGHLSKEQIKTAFPGSGIAENKFSFIYEYLLQNKIVVEEFFDPEEAMSAEDKDFLAMFMEEIEALPAFTEDEKRQVVRSAMEDNEGARARLLEMLLPKVVEIARLYAGQGVYMEDLIGEGNVALAAAVSMVSCLEQEEELEGFIARMIMDAMEVLVSAETDEKDVDAKILEKVNLVAEAAEALYQDLRRKVTPQELSEETGFTVAEIEEAYKLSGNQIETILIEEEA